MCRALVLVQAYTTDQDTVYLFMFVVYLITLYHYLTGPTPVTARFKPWVCGRSLDGIAGSNPATGMHVYLL